MNPWLPLTFPTGPALFALTGAESGSAAQFKGMTLEDWCGKATKCPVGNWKLNIDASGLFGAAKSVGTVSGTFNLAVRDSGKWTMSGMVMVSASFFGGTGTSTDTVSGSGTWSRAKLPNVVTFAGPFFQVTLSAPGVTPRTDQGLPATCSGSQLSLAGNNRNLVFDRG